MTGLEQIAASVAGALGLKRDAAVNWIDADGYVLKGSNVFGEHWQVRCRDWLLERPGWIELGVNCGTAHTYHNDGKPEGSSDVFTIECSAAEFCARAIHALMKPAFVSSHQMPSPTPGVTS